MLPLPSVLCTVTVNGELVEGFEVRIYHRIAAVDASLVVPD